MTAPIQSPPSGATQRDDGSLFGRRVLSWALYDLGNTIFSMNVVSFFLSIWVITVMGQTDTIWARANAVSMLAIFVTAPLLGALSDQAGRRLPLLLASTLGCVSLTFFLGEPGVVGTLVLFVFANYFFQAGLVFYDALLPVVSTAENRGRVSGFGVGLGYVGSFIGLGVGFLLRDVLEVGFPPVFKATAVLFLVFAVPVFLFVDEPSRPSRIRAGRVVRDAVDQVVTTFRHVGRYRGLGRFLVGRAFYTDAANTLIVFLGVYGIENVGFSEGTANILIATSVAAAIVGGFLWGPVVDRLGPKRTLNLVLLGWGVTLVLAAAIPVMGLPRELFWGVGALAGISLGGTWSADRPLMLVLAPPARVGEFYGLYSMVSRFSAVIGPLLWAFVAEDLDLGRPASVMVLALMVAVAWLVLRPVDDEPRSWSGADAEGGYQTPA